MRASRWKGARRSRAGEPDLAGVGPREHREMRHLVTTLALVLLASRATVFACPHCFGAEETGLIDGAKLGIIVMLGITFSVQGAFVGFFLYLRRRAKRLADIELDTEWSELQRGSRTS